MKKDRCEKEWGWIVFVFLLTVAFSACYSGNDPIDNNGQYKSNYGSFMAALSWLEETPMTAADGIDCVEAGVTKIMGTLYDENSSVLTSAEFECSAHNGTIHNILQGSDRKIIVTGVDSDGNVIYRGEESGITITSGATTRSGGILMAEVDVDANTNPEASITSPTTDREFEYGESITFSGSGDDVEDGLLSGRNLQWTSSIDGSIGEGANFVNSDLTSGVHEITLTVIDSAGGVGRDTVAIVVSALPNTSPEASINSPTTGREFEYGESITFSGSGDDAEDGMLSGSDLQWTSSIDGSIGEGAIFVKSDLTSGVHTITLMVTDSNGGVGTDTVTVEVIAQPNTNPIANIISPDDGESFWFKRIPFEGSGDDDEDGELSGSSLTWESNINGLIGEGNSFVNNDLSLGVHTITLTVTDSDGGINTDTITIFVW